MILAEKHKNTSTSGKKQYFLINEFQKNTIFTPIFVYFLYYFNANNANNAYIIICEKNIWVLDFFEYNHWYRISKTVNQIYSWNSITVKTVITDTTVITAITPTT